MTAKKKITKQRRYVINHPERRKAVKAVEWLISIGIIVRPKYCMCCGEYKNIVGRISAHHIDYEYPYLVVFLGQKCGCHKKFDKIRRAMDNVSNNIKTEDIKNDKRK